MSFITWKILREFITNYTELATLQFGSGLRCNVFLGAKIPQVTWNYAFIISLEKIPGFADADSQFDCILGSSARILCRHFDDPLKARMLRLRVTGYLSKS